MGKCIMINLIDYSKGLNSMKCPFCGIEMNAYPQFISHPKETKKRYIILYDHEITGKCKAGDGNTLSEQGWRERKTKS